MKLCFVLLNNFVTDASACCRFLQMKHALTKTVLIKIFLKITPIMCVTPLGLSNFYPDKRLFHPMSMATIINTSKSDLLDVYIFDKSFANTPFFLPLWHRALFILKILPRIHPEHPCMLYRNADINLGF